MLFRQTSLNIVFIGMLWIPLRFSIEFTLHSGFSKVKAHAFQRRHEAQPQSLWLPRESCFFIVLSASGIYNRFTALMSQLLRHGSQPPKKERSEIDFRAVGNSFGFFMVTKSHAHVEKPELNNNRVMSCRWTAAQITQRYSFMLYLWRRKPPHGNT